MLVDMMELDIISPDPGPSADLAPDPGDGVQQPTCDDELKNQGETDTDCGGPCAPCVDIETLDLDGKAGLFVNVATDGNGDVHGAYLTDYQSGGAVCCGLRYGRLVEGAWLTETITTDVAKGEVAIGAAGDGLVAVAYHDLAGALIVTRKTAQGWIPITVEPNAGGSVALLMDGIGNLSVAFAKAVDGGQVPIYATVGEEEVVPVVIEPTPAETIEGLSLALDSVVTPHVSWISRNGTGASIRVAARPKSTWLAEEADTGTGMDGNTALAFGPAGLALAYPLSGQLRLAQKEGGSWSVAPHGDGAPGTVRLAVGPAGLALSWFSPGQNQLRLQRVGKAEDAVVIDSGADAGRWHGLVADGDGSFRSVHHLGGQSAQLRIATVRF